MWWWGLSEDRLGLRLDRFRFGIRYCQEGSHGCRAKALEKIGWRGSSSLCNISYTETLATTDKKHEILVIRYSKGRLYIVVCEHPAADLWIRSAPRSMSVSPLDGMSVPIVGPDYSGPGCIVCLLHTTDPEGKWKSHPPKFPYSWGLLEAVRVHHLLRDLSSPI